jgi:glycosyltransferase involved in cell wall biosynthesis
MAKQDTRRGFQPGLSFHAMSRFSVVVPTRDRPDLLAFCLESLESQTFEDFEVIVSDNATSAPAREVFDRWARPGWRYLLAEKPLAMHDNFELGADAAEGDYVAVVIDKTTLHPSALEVADTLLASATGAEIVTWRNEGFAPLDEERELGPGRFVPVGQATAPIAYDPLAELGLRFENATRRGADAVHYVRGKIVFGAYSRTLLERIRAQTRRLFHPLAPDYSAMVPACVLAKSAIDVGRPLLVSYNSTRSNGRNQALDAGYARRFIESVDPRILNELPVSGVYASHHNVVAYDLVSAAARCPPGSTPALNMPNLLRRVREDLAAVQWGDPVERDEQYRLLAEAEREHGVAFASEDRRSLGDAVRGALGRLVARQPPRYESPVEAARAADRHYSQTVRT